jgi:O-antigen ligase
MYSKRWWIALTIPLQFFALSLSFSRAALFAWGLATLFWFTQMVLIRAFKDQKLKILGVIIALSFALSATLLTNQYFYRGGVISSNSLSKGSDNVRKVHQTTAIVIIKDAPLLGLGYGQFSERSAKYFSNDASKYVTATAPHNIFLFLATETGLISLAAFLLFILKLARAFFRSEMTTESALFSSLLLGFVFIGFCDFSPILFQQGKLMFFLICALYAANARRSTGQYSEPLPNTQEERLHLDVK